MKRDGRVLDHGALETIRMMAVERVREGEAPSGVIASYGCDGLAHLPGAVEVRQVSEAKIRAAAVTARGISSAVFTGAGR